MNEGIITSRYAKALYQTAEEDKASESVRKDILSLIETINESPEFKSFLNSPILKESQKIKIIDEIFNGKVHDLSLSFLKLLFKNKRELYLYSICLSFLQYYKKDKGITEGSIITAFPIHEDFHEEIKSFIKKKFKLELELNKQIDPSLIGGFKLKIDDRQIDASISSKLKKIKTELNNSY
ncbi:MAG: ATP synthase F1 subunit delta [Bacteroidales bacterium]|nr:ATP synthase F1 subunit delta [Bacteroidales bacterium]MBN2821222.1 ATP synthase F1 subunit delta [Bacteroidales bacterium]